MTLLFRAEIPLRLNSVANQRLHWAKKAKQTKALRYAMAIVPAGMSRHLPLIVTMTRVAPRTLDDDNATSACKAVRDGIASKIGIDDRSPLVTWRVQQRKGAPHYYGLEIEIKKRDEEGQFL